MFDTNTGLPSETSHHNGIELNPRDSRTWWQQELAGMGDWIPCRTQAPDHVVRLTGVSAKKFHSDPAAHVQAVMAVTAYYGFDLPTYAEDIYNLEAEALGQRLIYGDAMPTIDFREPLLATRDDLAKLKAPENWLEKGRVRYYLDVVRLMAEAGVGSAQFSAPFSLAVGLRTYPKLIRDMRRDPAFAHALFTVLVDEILPSYLLTAYGYTGVKIWSGWDAWAAYPNLTPDLLEEWVVPYAVRLTNNIQALGFVGMPIAGGDYCEEDLDKFDNEILWKTLDAQSHIIGGLPRFVLSMGRWHEYPLEPVVEYLARYKKRGATPSISANVNARVVRDGPVDRIVYNVKRLIGAFASDFDLLSVGSSTPSDTATNHVHALVAAVHTFGRRPVVGDLENVSFVPPRREAFQQYVEKMSDGAGLQL